MSWGARRSGACAGRPPCDGSSAGSRSGRNRPEDLGNRTSRLLPRTNIPNRGFPTSPFDLYRHRDHITSGNVPRAGLKLAIGPGDRSDNGEPHPWWSMSRSPCSAANHGRRRARVVVWQHRRTSSSTPGTSRTRRARCWSRHPPPTLMLFLPPATDRPSPTPSSTHYRHGLPDWAMDPGRCSELISSGVWSPPFC
jgi:hypothetical protein